MCLGHVENPGFAMSLFYLETNEWSSRNLRIPYVHTTSWILLMYTAWRTSMASSQSKFILLKCAFQNERNHPEGFTQMEKNEHNP
jgi:hypothetical protein